MSVVSVVCCQVEFSAPLCRGDQPIVCVLPYVGNKQKGCLFYNGQSNGAQIYRTIANNSGPNSYS
jgi:hypothetical protein